MLAARSPADGVIAKGVEFIVNSARPDGSWPIDTNLSIWVTTLSVNALAAAGDLVSLDRRDELLTWLLKQQIKEAIRTRGGPRRLGLERRTRQRAGLR